MDATKEAVQYLQLTKMWLINNGMDVVMAVIIFFVGRWLAQWAADLGQKALLRGGVDETLSRFLNKLSYYALLTAVVIAAADQLGIRTTSFIAILGAAGLAVGLALKDSLANFAAGVMLILFRPFKVGDLVTAAGVTGTVQVIDIFSTIILTADNQKVIVPNNGITSGIITNINSESTRRIDLTVRISHQDNIPKVKDLLTKIMLTEQRILADPAPAIAVAELTDFSVQIVVRPWVKTDDYWDVRFSLTEKIKLTFDKEGISFPFSLHNLQLLQGAGAQR